jgi:hypothetical protein
MAMGLPRSERNQIEGLQIRRSSTDGGERNISSGLTDDQLSAKAIARLVADPPSQIGELQRRTAKWLLRPYRNWLRFDSAAPINTPSVNSLSASDRDCCHLILLCRILVLQLWACASLAKT